MKGGKAPHGYNRWMLYLISSIIYSTYLLPRHDIAYQDIIHHTVLYSAVCTVSAVLTIWHHITPHHTTPHHSRPNHTIRYITPHDTISYHNTTYGTVRCNLTTYLRPCPCLACPLCSCPPYSCPCSCPCQEAFDSWPSASIDPRTPITSWNKFHK